MRRGSPLAGPHLGPLTPCGTPAARSDYPYGTGIGVYGFAWLRALSSHVNADIMGRLQPLIMTNLPAGHDFRRRWGSAVSAAAKAAALLIWVRIARPGRCRAASIRYPTNLPARPGPYTFEGIAPTALLFSCLERRRCQTIRGEPPFAFAVHLSGGRGKLRRCAHGPGGHAASTHPLASGGPEAGGTGVGAIVAREDRRHSRWSGIRVHPMIWSAIQIADRPVIARGARRESLLLRNTELVVSTMSGSRAKDHRTVAKG